MDASSERRAEHTESAKPFPGLGPAPVPLPLPRVALVALGCRVNRADLDALASELHGRFAVAAEGEPADFVVVNTCTITGDADAAARQAIRRAAKDHPEAQIVAAGCYAELSPETLAALPNVVAVVGVRSQTAIAGVLERLRACEPAGSAVEAARAEAPDWGAAPVQLARHTRPFLKIQDGCDCQCTYCVVPLARGWSRSLPFDEALARLARLGAQHREVVLTGVHLGAYGRDLGPSRSLEDLVRAAVARGFPGRLRLSSIEPLETPLELFRDPATAASLCEHVHLPLQSASEVLLARMRRPYRAAAYARVVEELAAASPGVCIGADVMCGFPGETDEDHAATVSLVETLPLAYLHVFPFSPRPGTPAAWYSPTVPVGLVRARVRELLAISDRKWRTFLHGLDGREVDVVVERIEGGVARGTARQWATVRWPASSERRGDLVRVRVDASDAGGCWGVRADRYRSALPV